MYLRPFNKKICCVKCKKEISIANFNKHFKSCKGIVIKVEYNFDNVGNNQCICNYCNKIYSINGIKSHIWRAHTEKGMKHTAGWDQGRERTSWKRGLTKETDERVRLNAESGSRAIRKLIADGKWEKRVPNKEFLTRLSEEQSLRNRGGKSKWYKVGNQMVQGTYEKRFAEFLESNDITWEKIKTNNRIFKYKAQNKTKSYAPDFYLPLHDLYIEIKGFWWGNDKQKMCLVREQHSADKNLILIFGKKELDFICENLSNLFNKVLWKF